MGCTYTYKGIRTFNSELELDNFLISNLEAFSKYGDLVFDRTTTQNTMLTNLHTIHTEKLERLKALGKSYREAHLPKFGFDDIDYSNSTNPYIGVTQMLQDIRIEKDGIMHRLFPEFMEEDFEEDGQMKKGFWSNKFDLWSKVTDLKSLPENDKECLFDKNSEGEYIYTPLTKEVMEKAKVRYKNKWKYLKIQGLAIHEIFNAFYSGDETDTSIRRYPKDKVEEALRKKLSKVKLTVSEEGEPLELKDFFVLIPESAFKTMIDNVLQFNKWVTKKCGYDSIFLPEFEITSTAINNAGVEVPLVGRVDLLVVDKNGDLQIFDYKVSPNEYGSPEYDSAKTRAFRYLFATYRRMLQRSGTPVNSSTKTYIVPLLMLNLHLLDNETWTYSSVKPYVGTVEDLTPSISAPDIEVNIQRFLPFDRKIAIKDAGDVLTRVDDMNRKCFPDYRDFKSNSEEDIYNELANDPKKPLERKNDKGRYETSRYGRKIEANTPEELIKKCKERIDGIFNSAQGTFDTIKSGLKNAQDRNQGELFNYEGKVSQNKDYVIADWTDKYLGQYANYNWEVLDSKDYPALKLLDALGILAIQNKITRVIDFVKVSNSRLYSRIPLGHNLNNLLGTYMSDNQVAQIPNELALTSERGNIELMEVMMALNSIPSLFNDRLAIIGNVSTINPYFQEVITASNKLLLYNFALLNTLAKLGDNNFSIKGEDNKILMCSTADLVKFKFNEVISEMEANGYSGKLANFKKFKSMVSEWDSFMGNPVILRSKLVQLSKMLEDEFKIAGPDSNYNHSPEYIIYSYVQDAIAEIDGFDFKQLLEGHDSYLENGKWWLGWTGTMVDNPGNQSSQILNTVAKTQTIAYQNIRDEMMLFVAKMLPLLKALKESKQAHKSLLRGEIDYFDNLTEIVGEPGHQELVFKDPYDEHNNLTTSEREFLKFALTVINENRGYDIEDYKYFNVPLMKGGLDSKLLSKTMGEAIQEKFNALNPKKVISKLNNIAKGLLKPDTKNTSTSRKVAWEMSNTFDAGEDKYTRENLLNEDITSFERNIETLLLAHTYAAITKRSMDEMFPTIKAAMMHLYAGKFHRNDVNANFDEDINYLEQYITAKIFNESIVKENYREIENVSKKVMSITSKLALGLNPHQLYLALDGVWKDCSLIWRNHFGGNIPYSKDVMQKAFFTVYRDIAPNSDNSVASLLNKQYGINDMDMNLYVNRIKSDQSSFDNFLFKFAARPDFYNRMTMIVAQMMYDGSYDAHSVINDNLVYDWTKDSRFNLYAADPTGNNTSDKLKWNEQKALYVAMAKLFMYEQTSNTDGTKFIVTDFTKPKALPRAYTTQQMESHKSETDKIYGYYSHEKKSLFQSTLAGSLLMQMNTYWSSKKNQYLGKSGINIQGHFEHYKEAVRNEDGTVKKDDNGNIIYEKWYEIIDENGSPTGQYIPESKIEDPNKVIPFMAWKGRFEEGIIVTLAKIFQEVFYGDESGQKGWNHMTQAVWNNEDENLRMMYRNNLVQLLHDLFMWWIMGLLVIPLINTGVNDYCKKHSNKGLGQAMINFALKEAVAMTRSSFDDFDFIKSIGGRGVNWTPFSLLSVTRQYETMSRLLGGKIDLYDATVKSIAATRTTEPIWDFVKINTLGEKIGEKK